MVSTADIQAAFTFRPNSKSSFILLIILTLDKKVVVGGGR